MSAQRKSRITRQRQVISEQLRAVTSHPTAGEVFEMVRRRLPHISLGTVYRNLELLARGGAIRKLRLGSAQSRFDGDTSDHCHVRCMVCGRVDDVAIKPLRAIENAFHRVRHYHVLGYTLEFTGVCAHCAKGNRDRLKMQSTGSASAQRALRESDRRRR